MSSKYKSPLIRSRNASAANGGPSPPSAVAAASPAATGVRSGCSPADDHDRSDDDGRPQPSPAARQRSWRGRGHSTPGFYGSPRPPRGSPYQWTPPTGRFGNCSWSSDQSNAGSYTSQEKNGYSPYKSHFNKYKKHNTNNSNNENSNESYFHPSMLEDPWAALLNSSVNNAE